MTKEEIKSLVREKMSTKRIVLFGAGEVAEEFFEEHKDKLNISHCVSNIESEWGEKVFLGELDVNKYCKEELQENDYIIVCGPVAFRTIELQLNEDGMRMYEHFVESKIAKAIYEGKRIALFYGQCVLRDIYEEIIHVPSFRKEYAAVFTQTNKGQTVVINRLLFYLKDLCDIYIYTPKILDRDSAYSLALEELPKNCKVISVSNLIVSIYWPQINADLEGYNEWYLYPYNAERDMDFFHTMYRREDSNINRLVLEGKTTNEIVNILSADDFYTEKEVKRHLNLSLKLIDIAERDIDIKMADYIRENYRRDVIYQNYIHANKCIIWEYVRRLLKEIDVSSEEADELERKAPLHSHQGGDVPIYPSVAKHLQLDFIDDETRYEVMTGRGIVLMSFEEYTEHYVEYTKKAMEIKQMWLGGLKRYV